jgi:hypothetical protein
VLGKKFGCQQFRVAVEKFNCVSVNVLCWDKLAGFTDALNDRSGGLFGRRVLAGEIGYPDTQHDQEQAGWQDIPGQQFFVFMSVPKSCHEGYHLHQKRLICNCSIQKKS